MSALVSVIIPCYNGEKYVVDAVESALNQSYKNIEVIVVDDGSTDASLELLREKFSDRIQLLTHPNHSNLGVSRSRKLGVNAAKGKFIAFLDADDYFFSDKIAIQLAIIENSPRIALVHSCVKFTSESETQTNFSNDFRFADSDKQYDFLSLDYLNRNPVCNSTVLIRRELLLNLDIAFTQLFQYEDWITWILAAQKGQFYYIDRPLVNYRYHSNSSTFQLLKTPLKSTYARLEMLFILMGRVTDQRVRATIYKTLDLELRNGIRQYTPEHGYRSLYRFYGEMLLNSLKNKLRSLIPFSNAN